MIFMINYKHYNFAVHNNLLHDLGRDTTNQDASGEQRMIMSQNRIIRKKQFLH